MDTEFWLTRWQRQEIGFHQDEINPYLQQYRDKLSAHKVIFVPLCGKSRDLIWLREQGHQVIGIELSPLAVQAFFDENGLHAECHTEGKFSCYRTDGIEIWCGDFFDLTAHHLSSVNAVYDRAALIALPPNMQADYVSHLYAILPAQAPTLLITLNYAQDEMSGPPFATPIPRVQEYYQAHREVGILTQQDALEDNPRFKQRGVTWLQENVLWIGH